MRDGEDIAPVRIEKTGGGGDYRNPLCPAHTVAILLGFASKLNTGVPL